jgi:uncharacterized protein
MAIDQTVSQQLSLADARRIAVAAQALDRPRQATSPDDVLAMVRRLGCVQIDTIHVVARSPYFVLWSRLGDYDPRWLDQLLHPRRDVFEYWAHAASIIPIEHWPLFRGDMLRRARGETGWGHEWRRENQHVLEHVIDEIRARGPLGAADFAAPPDHRGGGWWEWKPAKRALDMLWSAGELMIERRVNFHRRYDLRERVLPDWDDSQLPPEEERRRRLAEIALRAMGIATTRQLADYFRQPVAGLRETLDQLVDTGLAERVIVEGWDAPAYAWRESLAMLDAPAPSHTTLLTPFDSLVWHRERTRALWGFDYVLECYVPAPRRRYGYFVLSILRRGELIGRLDAKAERKDGVFRIKALFLEPGVTPDAVSHDIAAALIACARWHNTPEVIIERADPPAARESIELALRRDS